jgi:hypothetical protein
MEKTRPVTRIHLVGQVEPWHYNSAARPALGQITLHSFKCSHIFCNMLFASMPVSTYLVNYFILTEAVRRNACAVRSTDASIEKDVQKWLRQACDRDGGRQERYKKNLSGKGGKGGKIGQNGMQMSSDQLASGAELSQ